MSMPKIPVTVVVPVKNEERSLAMCLAALSRFAHVIVVDSQSTDGTPELARHYGAQVVQFDWNGRYPKKRNWMLMNYDFPTRWVLFLDADEVLNEGFCDEVYASLLTDEFNGFWLNYTNHFCGRRLSYGVPQRKLALFKVGSALYEKIDEVSWSRLDMEIHEHPIVDGRVGEIRTSIEHHEYGGIQKFLKRHCDYVEWEARRLLLLEQAEEGACHSLTDRQRLKYAHLAKWWYPWTYFGYAYFLRFGFLDGAAGFYYAFFKLWYFLSIRIRIRELRENNSG